MKHAPFLIVLALLAWKPGDSGVSAVWLERWGILSAAIGSVLVCRHARGIFPRAFLLYVLGSASAAAFLGGFFDGDLITVMRSTSARHLVAALAFVGFLASGLDLGRALRWAAWFVLGLILISPEPTIGITLVRNPTMAATFVVLASRLHPLSILAVVLTRAWIPGLALAGGLAWPWFVWFPGRVRAAIVAVGLVVAGWIVIGGHVPDNGRLVIWRDYLAWWADLPLRQILLGFGGGSGGQILPQLAADRALAAGLDHVETYWWAHSDWLQLLGEYGVAGLALGLAAAGELFWRADLRQRARLLAFAISMCGNFPTHWALQALVGWALVAEIQKKRDHAPARDPHIPLPQHPMQVVETGRASLISAETREPVGSI